MLDQVLHGLVKYPLNAFNYFYLYISVEEGNLMKSAGLDFLNSNLICILETKCFSPIFHCVPFLSPSLACAWFQGKGLPTSFWFLGTQNQTYLEN